MNNNIPETILIVKDSGDASQRIETLRQRVAASPVPWQDQQFSIAILLGHLCGQVTELDELPAKTDELLYRARQNGRNRVEELLVSAP